MIVNRALFNSRKSCEFIPCNLYFCKCVEYLQPNKKKDILFYKHCHRTNMKENYNIKITWEEHLIRNGIITHGDIKCNNNLNHYF